ncbi:hypothetical protein FJTKL_00801 [Diaporthe vaccinii]|uniref:Uncharacterized protein n=1 Tax=Diaporthe vaccinii TaxID=105482 RepID=A0ABR4E2A5_9PEZI
MQKLYADDDFSGEDEDDDSDPEDEDSDPDSDIERIGRQLKKVYTKREPKRDLFYKEAEYSAFSREHPELERLWLHRLLERLPAASGPLKLRFWQQLFEAVAEGIVATEGVQQRKKVGFGLLLDSMVWDWFLEMGLLRRPGRADAAGGSKRKADSLSGGDEAERKTKKTKREFGGHHIPCTSHTLTLPYRV